MTDLLVRDALSEIWGNPDPFNQVILKPSRLSAINGVNKRIAYGWGILEMPNKTSTFHVYQTGQISPVLLNLTNAKSTWQLFSDACNETKVMVDIYTILGVELPKTRCWFRWVEKKNILFAVEVNHNIDVPWATLEIYLRMYKNSFFETNGLGVGQTLHVGGGIISSISALGALQAEINAKKQLPEYLGGMVCFVNGLKVDAINVLTAKVGDVAEYVFDTSIYKIVDFQISRLSSFMSRLDSKSKGLLHYDAPEDTLIDYEDHIDIYMYDAVTKKGVYVHKNAADTLRQLTHKDYAIALDYLPAYYVHFKDANGFVNTANLRLRLYVRYSGQGYMPQRDANMSRYLSKLNALQQRQAMLGVTATLALWQAASLEESAYMRLMRSTYDDIDTALVQDAYGYARVNAILGNAILPTTIVESQAVVNIPAAFQISATAFEYDASGVLLGVHACAPNSVAYYPVEAGCTTVEFVEGLGSTILDEYVGSDPVVLSDSTTYRYYLKVADAPLNIPTWQDVTGTEHYHIESGVAYWGDNTITNSLERLIRGDKKFLSYETTMDISVSSVHQISYSKLTDQGYINTAMSVPMGELDVWLNDKPLVRGVDYVLNFPTLSITNKEHLEHQMPADTWIQRLRIRMTGFCDEQLNLNPISEIGYVYNGVLSADSQYDLYAEKVIRVVLGGALKRTDEVLFIETDSASGVLGSPIEGKPYEIRDVINRLNGQISKDAYALYHLDRANELAAMNYLSQRIEQTAAHPVSPIAQRYELFSPFLFKVLSDLDAGYIDLSEFTAPFSDATVRSLCAPYMYLLALDPIGSGNTPDLTYCVIHPHPYGTIWSLAVLKYRFFERVVKIFAGEKVVYSSLVNLT